MTLIVADLIKNIEHSKVWKMHQKLEPILIAAKQDDVFILEEHYSDLADLECSSIVWVMKRYTFKYGEWYQLGFKVFEKTPELEILSFALTQTGYNVTERKTLSKNEVLKTFENDYATVTVDEFFLNDTDEHLEVSCYIEGSVLDTAYSLDIDTYKLEEILCDMKITQGTNSDGDIIVDMNTFDNIYDVWETLLLTEDDKREILKRYMDFKELVTTKDTKKTA